MNWIRSLKRRYLELDEGDKFLVTVAIAQYGLIVALLAVLIIIAYLVK